MQVLLTKGVVCTISDEDEDLASFKWRADIGRYAVREEGYQNIIMHRIILGRKLGRELRSDELVDHKNTDPTDNTRDNLRLATPSQNAVNTGLRSTNKSGYRGVAFYKRLGNWTAEITHQGKRLFLGYFNTPEEASEVYKSKARELHGEFYHE